MNLPGQNHPPPPANNAPPRDYPGNRINRPIVPDEGNILIISNDCKRTLLIATIVLSVLAFILFIQVKGGL